MPLRFFYSHTLAHGQYLSYTTFGCKSNKCTSYAYGEVCNDGILNKNVDYLTPSRKSSSPWWRNYFYSGPPTKVGTYDPLTNTHTQSKTIGDRWGIYFSDADIQDCGTCDLKRKTPHKNKLNEDAYFKIRNKE